MLLNKTAASKHDVAQSFGDPWSCHATSLSPSANAGRAPLTAATQHDVAQSFGDPWSCHATPLGPSANAGRAPLTAASLPHDFAQSIGDSSRIRLLPNTWPCAVHRRHTCYSTASGVQHADCWSSVLSLGVSSPLSPSVRPHLSAFELPALSFYTSSAPTYIIPNKTSADIVVPSGFVI